MFRMFLRCAALLAVAVAIGACSDESGSSAPPTSPSPPLAPTAPPPPSGVANISGGWNGAFGFQQNGVQSNPSVTASINQNDRTITGTMQFTSPGWDGWRATINGLVAGNSPDTEFVGTIEITTPSTTGTGVCVGQATFAGRSATNSIRWDAESITLSSNIASQPPEACRGRLLLPAWILFR